MNYNSESGAPKNRALMVCAIIAGVLVVCLLGLFGFCKILLGTDKIYKGVTVLGQDMGGYTQAEAEYFLEEKFELDLTKTVTLSCEGISESFVLSEIAPELDAAGTARELFSYARYGAVIDRVKMVLSLKNETVDIPVSVSLDEDALFVYTDKLTQEAGRPMEEISSELDGDVLTVTPGKPGMEIDPSTAVKEIVTSLANKKYDISLSLEETEPSELSAEVIYSKFYKDPKDATFTLSEDKKEITYVDSVTGIHFDKATAKDAIDKAQEGEKVSFNVTVIEPDVSTGELKEKMFRDRLATYSSKYNEGVVGRSYNVKLASKFIDGVILMPGDVFSYNDVVGPRTLSRGFKEANVYVGSEVEVGVGGGICQVSSTLFNSVVMSGLSIVSRTNHSLPVSYVPLGRDATVSYGSIDFKFSNPYDMPVKIAASASEGVNTVAIYGTNANPSRKISFETELVRTIPYTAQQTEDPSLPQGEVKIEQRGANGAVYNTYKVVTENGTVISRSLLTKSTYNATNQKEIVGTGEAVDASIENNAQNAENMPSENTNSQGNENAAENEPENLPDEPRETEGQTPIEQSQPTEAAPLPEENKPSIKPVAPGAGE